MKGRFNVKDVLGENKMSVRVGRADRGNRSKKIWMFRY
jgi:hypothetical protein